ncbi:hypothetical protein A7P98_01950 [Eikenella sp. NML080894]|uniref:lysozyme inhibitor LprI family protein n=1 Tax=Eikenella TaxID=538 RepID=UPI0007DFFF75|nr:MULTISPECIES: lysozyme inhibitor LprI family protein [Eikenella]OAM36746.1 hypothetical protein A7P98_01950 [Eikenella sp. NML080894]OAM39830.1 hypothetical protein A7P99_01025 [Eikenella sp. NML120348]OAM45912.1 hypothetical protein A7Q03_01030 [Eikenella sp. NML99-0057]
MNPLIKPVLALLIAASLAACGKEEAKPAALSCQAPEALEQLKAQIQATAFPPSDSELPAPQVGAAEIQAALDQLGFEITDIRTTQAASEDNKQLACEATLRFAPKPEAQARLKQSISDYMEINESDGIEYNEMMTAGDPTLKPDGQGGYIRPLNYTVSQTDSGDKLVINVDSKTASSGLQPPLSFYLTAPDLAKQVAEIRQKSAAEETRQQELNTLDQNRLQARIELLRTENKQAQENLNKTWQALPDAVQTALKDAQSQWARLRVSQCTYQSKADSTDPLEQEALRIECDTRELQQRIPTLKQEAETFTGNQLTEATQRAQAAQQELRNVWQSVPADVKDIIGQDYQSWAASSAAKCAQAAQQAGGGNNGQLARLECTATEARNKAKELRGYVSQ